MTSTRSPFLRVVAPGVSRPGRVCARPVDFAHICRTLGDLSGLSRPAHVEDLSIRPLLADASAGWTTPAVLAGKFDNYGERCERWRYIRDEDFGEEHYDPGVHPREGYKSAGDSRFTCDKSEPARWWSALNRHAVAASPPPA